MDSLHISLFGQVHIVYEGKAVISLPPIAQRLFAYLVLNRYRRYRREVLTEIFWEDANESRARSCLNSALWRLRCALEPQGITRGTYLLTTPTGEGEIGFNAESCYWLDVERFEQGVRPILAQRTPITPEQAQELEQSLQFYVGDLLEGTYMDWVLGERERLRQLFLDGLICLMRYYRYEMALEQSLSLGKRILTLEPLREDIHRAVMEIYWVSGQRALAVQQYKTCCQVLGDELGVKPMKETQLLYQQFLTADAQPTVAPPASPRPANQLSESVEQAMRQLSLAMQSMEQTQTQMQRAIQTIKQSLRIET